MSPREKNIQIVAILGSMRANSFTGRALDLAIDELKKTEGVSVKVLDPSKMKLAFPGQKEHASLKKVRKDVSAASGIIMATPEYQGSYSSIIKLIIENLDYPSILAGKPVALCGIAGGRIGAIKALEHLQSVCVSSGALVLPGAVSVASVYKVFDEKGRCTDKEIEDRLRALARRLIAHIRSHSS